MMDSLRSAILMTSRRWASAVGIAGAVNVRIAANCEKFMPSQKHASHRL